MFKHVPSLVLPDLSAETSERGRFYTTPEGKAYPSVTTVLSYSMDKQWLEDWKARVGEEGVKKISTQAARRGTVVHELAEQYMLNNPEWKRGHMPANIMSFEYIRKYLDKHVGLIAGLELPLYSDHLRVAGRSDCIAKWDNEWSIIDFKTSKREKTKQDIQGYFLQASCYAYMFFERTGMVVPKIVILMTVDDGPPLIFEERSRDYIKKFIELRENCPL